MTADKISVTFCSYDWVAAWVGEAAGADVARMAGEFCCLISSAGLNSGVVFCTTEGVVLGVIEGIGTIDGGAGTSLWIM